MVRSAHRCWPRAREFGALRQVDVHTGDGTPITDYFDDNVQMRDVKSRRARDSACRDYFWTYY